MTSGTTADCQQAQELMSGQSASELLADRGYDTNQILELAESFFDQVVIPPKKNRLKQREYDHESYRKRHRVENAFLKLKQCRGIATRYAKKASSFLAAIHMKCILIWIQSLS